MPFFPPGLFSCPPLASPISGNFFLREGESIAKMARSNIAIHRHTVTNVSQAKGKKSADLEGRGRGEGPAICKEIRQLIAKAASSGVN